MSHLQFLWRLNWASAVATCLLGSTCESTLWAGDAESDESVVKVCEEWEVTVGEPNSGRNAPQLTMIMSPNGDLEHDYFSFLLNFHVDPDYRPGGMQVIRYRGDRVEDSQSAPLHDMLHHDGETIRWRQTLSVHEGLLTFEVDQGSSESWGSFGENGQLRTTASTSLTNLNSYLPRISLTESGIGFAGNRVESLQLTRLEWHLSDGRTFVLTAPIDIDSDLDPWAQ